MKFFIIRYVILLFCISLSFSASAQEVVSSKLDKDSILIGDQIKWRSVLNLPKEMRLDTSSLFNVKVTGLELFNHRLDTLSSSNNSYNIEATSTITSFDSGEYSVSERWLKCYSGDELVDSIKVPAQKLVVTTFQIDTANYVIHDIKPQFEYPITFKETIPWISMVLGLLALAYIVFRVIKNLKRNRTVFGRPIVVDPPHIIALRELEKIRADKLWQENKQKQYYTAVTDALRMYIESRYNVPAVESTSKEILSLLKDKDIPVREYAELSELFETADLVKFAKYIASELQNENAIPAAVRFVNTTFMQELTPIDEGGQDNE